MACSMQNFLVPAGAFKFRSFLTFQPTRLSLATTRDQNLASAFSTAWKRESTAHHPGWSHNFLYMNTHGTHICFHQEILPHTTNHWSQEIRKEGVSLASTAANALLIVTPSLALSSSSISGQIPGSSCLERDSVCVNQGSPVSLSHIIHHTVSHHTSSFPSRPTKSPPNSHFAACLVLFPFLLLHLVSVCFWSSFPVLPEEDRSKVCLLTYTVLFSEGFLRVY